MLVTTEITMSQRSEVRVFVMSADMVEAVLLGAARTPVCRACSRLCLAI